MLDDFHGYCLGIRKGWGRKGLVCVVDVQALGLAVEGRGHLEVEVGEGMCRVP